MCAVAKRAGAFELVTVMLMNIECPRYLEINKLIGRVKKTRRQEKTKQNKTHTGNAYVQRYFK